MLYGMIKNKEKKKFNPGPNILYYKNYELFFKDTHEIQKILSPISPNWRDH